MSRRLRAGDVWAGSDRCGGNSDRQRPKEASGGAVRDGVSQCRMQAGG